MRGVTLRRRRNGQSALRLHYSSIPDRDPETENGQKWFRRERKNYSSKSNWDKEQEIDPYTSGGEQVFGHIFGEHYQAVVISDPNWYPKPEWDVVGGFDHGKRNATAMLNAYVTRAPIDSVTGRAGLHCRRILRRGATDGPTKSGRTCQRFSRCRTASA
jgi:hypothetical protein